MEGFLISMRVAPVITDLSDKESSSSKPIYVTKCLSEKCTGSYTDTISESILILCKDPKHTLKESAGHVTNDRPAAEDASSNSIEVDLHGKEALT